MTSDFFELLNEPRRPWLDAEELKKKFLALSAAVHPDRVHGSNETERQGAQARYAELNLAYNRLREPKERLQHFFFRLEFQEAPGRPRSAQCMLGHLRPGPRVHRAYSRSTLPSPICLIRQNC